MNALKTGIDAKTQIIQGESPAALQELTAEYYQRFQPATPEQRLLVDSLIDGDWLLRRFRAIETHLWEWALNIYDRSLGRVFTEYGEEFTRLQRRIDTTQRNYRNALHELRLLQAQEARPEPLPEAPPEPVSARSQTSKPANGFLPQIASDAPSDPPPALLAAPPEPLSTQTKSS